MVIYTLLFLLLFSFSVHIVTIVLYINSKSRKAFNWFVSTLVTNMVCAIGLSVYALQRPESIQSLDIRFILWVISGLIMTLMLFIKISIFRNIRKRMKNPEFYHLNVFGKKVYEQGIIKKGEYLAFMITIPFFMLIGAYFIARLINYFIYGQI